MSDPLDILRREPSPVFPDPEFADRLRGRLTRELARQDSDYRLGADMSPTPASSTTSQPAETTTAETATPAMVPYLAAQGAREAIDWYVDVFGATLVDDPIVMPDGRIGHSELRIGQAVIYLSDAHPEIGVVAPTPGETSVSLMLTVDDADAVLARAQRAGGRSDREPYDAYGRRNAWMVDPFGHRWGLNSPVRA